MVSKRDGMIVIWPRYFDADRTRQQGRRVPVKDAVHAPRAGHIAEAARTLGLDATLEKDAAHPSEWWVKEGRVLVKKKWSKEETIRKIAGRL